MKLRFFVFFSILVNLNLNAQDEIKKKQFLIGVFASPDICYRFLANSTGTSGYIAGNRNSYETPKFAYTGGFEALYQLKPKLSASLGIQYSLKGEKTKDFDLIYGDQLDPRRGYTYTSPDQEPIKANFKYNTSYIDLPVRLDYYFTKRKFTPFVTTGISTNIFLNEKIITTTTYRDDHEEKSTGTGNKGYYRINPQFQFGAGLDVAFERSRLRIFPIYRMSLSRVNSGSVSGYFYSLGLGLNYFIGL